MNKHLNKIIALVVAVIVGLVLLHNLYMYEINYGVTTGVIEHQTHQNNDDAKAFFAVLIVLNGISLFCIVLDYFLQDPSSYYPRKINFNLFDILDENLVAGIIMFFTYIIDGLITLALLVYLLYLAL